MGKGQAAVPGSSTAPKHSQSSAQQGSVFTPCIVIMNKQPQDSPRNWSIFLLTSGVICKNNSKNKGIIQVKGKKAKFKHKRHHRYRNTQRCQGTITPHHLFNKVQLDMEQLKKTPTQQTSPICRGDVSHQTKYKIYMLSLREERQLSDRN